MLSKTYDILMCIADGPGHESEAASSLRRCSVRKGVLINFAKFTGTGHSGTGVFL